MKTENLICKGKRISDGKWITGYFVEDPAGNSRIYYQPFEEATSNTYQIVYANTVCQFIGRKDKNGNKIFYGDEIHYQWSRGAKRIKTGDVTTNITFKNNLFCPEINETTLHDWTFPYQICELTGKNIHDKTL